MKCPICNKAVKPRAKNPSFPFCTQRCKTIDLGKWLNEEYRVPTEEADEDESESERDVRH
jgi:endogenous inhibitor of DNA gyrase (YacG/DUF329 family)